MSLVVGGPPAALAAALTAFVTAAASPGASWAGGVVAARSAIFLPDRVGPSAFVMALAAPALLETVTGGPAAALDPQDLPQLLRRTDGC